MKLVQVTAPNFVAAFVVGDDGMVERAAPILRKWVMGKPDAEARRICRMKRWSVEEIEGDRHAEFRPDYQRARDR